MYCRIDFLQRKAPGAHNPFGLPHGRPLRPVEFSITVVLHRDWSQEFSNAGYAGLCADCKTVGAHELAKFQHLPVYSPSIWCICVFLLLRQYDVGLILEWILPFALLICYYHLPHNSVFNFTTNSLHYVNFCTSTVRDRIFFTI